MFYVLPAVSFQLLYKLKNVFVSVRWHLNNKRIFKSNVLTTNVREILKKLILSVIYDMGLTLIWCEKIRICHTKGTVCISGWSLKP